jgi:hypothetical protein
VTQPAGLGDLSYVRLVALSDTPPAVVQYHGLIVGLRPADLADMGSGPENPGTLAGVFGHSRPVQGPPSEDGLTIAAEWVMTPPIPAAVVEAFRVIPGPEGWQVNASRNAYRNIGQALILTHGLPAVEVLDALRSLYGAAVTEAIARRAAGYPIS